MSGSEGLPHTLEQQNIPQPGAVQQAAPQANAEQPSVDISTSTANVADEVTLLRAQKQALEVELSELHENHLALLTEKSAWEAERGNHAGVILELSSRLRALADDVEQGAFYRGEVARLESEQNALIRQNGLIMSELVAAQRNVIALQEERYQRAIIALSRQQ